MRLSSSLDNASKVVQSGIFSWPHIQSQLIAQKNRFRIVLDLVPLKCLYYALSLFISSSKSPKKLRRSRRISNGGSILKVAKVPQMDWIYVAERTVVDRTSGKPSVRIYPTYYAMLMISKQEYSEASKIGSISFIFAWTSLWLLKKSP